MIREHQEYIANMMRHASYKKYENYVINQIYWTLVLNRGIELKLITQQTVFRKNNINHVAYMDGYFPALNIELEIDEAHHLNQKIADKKREEDIEFQMGALKLDVAPIVLRVDCTKDLDKQISTIVDKICKRYEECGKPEWIDEDPVKKVQTAKRLSFEDNIIFRYKSDILKAIGFKMPDGRDYPKMGTQRLTSPILKDGRNIWFPTMNGNIDYKNSYDIVNDKFITSVSLDKANVLEEWVKAKKTYKAGKTKDAYVFFKVKDAFNKIGYKYFGRYHAESYDEKTETFIWKRVSTEDFKCIDDNDDIKKEKLIDEFLKTHTIAELEIAVAEFYKQKIK